MWDYIPNERPFLLNLLRAKLPAFCQKNFEKIIQVRAVQKTLFLPQPVHLRLKQLKETGVRLYPISPELGREYIVRQSQTLFLSPRVSQPINNRLHFLWKLHIMPKRMFQDAFHAVRGRGRVR